MFQNRMNHPLNWIMALWCAGVLLNMRTLPAEIGLTSQPEPLGYPGSLDDPADALAEKKSGSIWAPPKRVDDLQVPAVSQISNIPFLALSHTSFREE